MKGERPHFSATSMGLLFRCGEAYRRRYIEGHKIPPGIAGAVGKATDTSVNGNLLAKKETGQLLPLEAVAEMARDSFCDSWDSGILLSQEEASCPEAAKGEALDLSVRLAELHATSLAPDITPAMVQQGWRVEIDGYPYDLIGFIDIVDERGEEGVWVRDTKTGKAPARTAADDSEQLTLYYLGATVGLSLKPAGLSLDHLVDLRKGAEVRVLPTRRSDADLVPLLNRFEQAVKIAEAGIFHPADPERSWWCSARWCGYHSTCPYVRRPITIQAPKPAQPEKRRKK